MHCICVGCVEFACILCNGGGVDVLSLVNDELLSVFRTGSAIASNGCGVETGGTSLENACYCCKVGHRGFRREGSVFGGMPNT